jgi:hypothetical protein
MNEDMNGNEQPATKADMHAMRTDIIATTRSEMASGFKSLRDDIRDMLHPIIVKLTHHDAELADIRGYIKTQLVTRDEFHSRMDAFTGRVEDFDFTEAQNRARLDEHEQRIIALEKKPS